MMPMVSLILMAKGDIADPIIIDFPTSKSL